MSQVVFEEDQQGGKRMQRQQPLGFVSNFILRYSGGLVTNQTQAHAVQVVLIVICCAAMLLYWRSSSESIAAPSAELINAEQPVQPLP
jgi:hypothetical protein